MAIVYQHKRKDNDKVFYVGISTQNKRAYSKHSRSIHWHSIVNKVGNVVEILLENISWKDACMEEMKLIETYGRKDLGLGLLVNMTNGGEGTLGRVYNSLDLEMMSQRMIGSSNHMYGKSGKAHNRYGKHHSDHTRQRIAEAVKGEKNARYGKPNTFLSIRNKEKIKGSIWVTDGKTNKRLPGSVLIPVGFYKGKTNKTK